MDKSLLRQMIKKDLRSLSDSVHLEKSKSLSKNLLSLLKTINSKHCDESLLLGGFTPIQREPLWFCEFDKCENPLLLVHMHKDFKLTYYPVDFKELEAGRTALELREELRGIEGDPHIVLVPGLAFTKTGKRLGRGKGYFDRYLENRALTKIGLCFELQIKENVLSEAHDIEMDYLVTEKNIYRRG